jgi:hypothetical protein
MPRHSNRGSLRKAYSWLRGGAPPANARTRVADFGQQGAAVMRLSLRDSSVPSFWYCRRTRHLRTIQRFKLSVISRFLPPTMKLHDSLTARNGLAYDAPSPEFPCAYAPNTK